jgi:hypothetical protein
VREPIDPTSVAAIGRELVRRVEMLYADHGVSLPTRRIWAAGSVPPECEQLVVSFTGLREGLIEGDNAPNRPCETLVVAEFKVRVSRCVPVGDDVGNPPSPEEIGAAADMLSTDSYLLVKLAGCYFDLFSLGSPGGGRVVYGVDGSRQIIPGGMGVDISLEVEDPQGGMQSVVLTLSMVVG